MAASGVTVVAFRDALEEATAAAHAARSDDTTPAPAAVAVPATPGQAVLPATTVTPDAATQPTPFEPVDGNPATVEPLPATP